MTRDDLWACIDTVIQAALMLGAVYYLINL